MRFRRRAVAGVLAVALVTGVALRVRSISANRSLWLDPAMLALNVIEKGYGELLGRLDMNQAAPPGFLLVSKTVGSMADYSEFSLRLVPFVFGVAALGLFLWVSIRVLGLWKSPLAFIPAATGSTAVFYSAEFKQYSGDLFFSVALLLVSLLALDGKRGPLRIGLWFGLGVVALWFSYSAAFVIAGSGIVLTVSAVSEGDRRQKVVTAMAVTMAAVHLALFVQHHVRPSMGDAIFHRTVSSYVPLLPLSGEQWMWWWRAIEGYFEFPLGSGSIFIAPLAALVVGVVDAASDRSRPLYWAIIGSPLVCLVVASGLHLYPIATGTHEVNSRFVLFTTPFVLLLMARGIGRLLAGGTTGVVIGIALTVTICVPSIVQGLRDPRVATQEMRPIVRYLQENLEVGDSVYVFVASVPAFRYYTRHQPIDAVEGRPARDPERDLPRDLRRMLSEPRVWVVVSHAYRGERKVLKEFLGKHGRLTNSIRRPGARLLLYEMKSP